MDEYYAIEKFTRCFHCRSFSLKAETDSVPERLSGSTFVCRNCGTRYVVRRNTLEEIDPIMPLQKPEIPGKEPLRVKRTSPIRNAVFLFPFLGLVVVIMIFIFYSWNRDQSSTTPSPSRLEEQNTSPQLKERTPKEKKKEVNPVPAAAISGEAREETLRIESGGDTKKQAEQKLKDTGQVLSYKIVDSSWLKIRKSSPDFSDKSRQWNFKRKSLSIRRSRTQRVMIAGDASGKSKWGVDDELVINGERIKGLSGEMTEPGKIPDSRQITPYDITYLVPADRETVLDIRLVDYGIFWGNTSLYIVILQGER
jgi:hypothetical protein